MIHKNRLHAIYFILPGFAGSLATHMLTVSFPAHATPLNVLSGGLYLLYSWGFYNLTIGKGYSKWFMLLFLTPFFPAVIVMLLLKDKNRGLETDQELRFSKRVLQATTFFCVWFGAIFLIHVCMLIFVMPTLNLLDSPLYELRLPPQDKVLNGEFSLLGLKLGQAIEGAHALSAVPLFKSHKVEGFNVVLSNGSIHVGNILIKKIPDDLKVEDEFDSPLSRHLYCLLFFNNSRARFIKSVYAAKVDDFSVWNLPKDIRLLYLLLEKAIRMPVYLKNGKISRVATDKIDGILTLGKAANSRWYLQLYFANDHSFYDVIVITRYNIDIATFVRSIAGINDAEALRLADCYPRWNLPKDLQVATKISSNLTTQDLEDLSVLINQHVAAGYKIPQKELEAELQYRKATHETGPGR